MFMAWASKGLGGLAFRVKDLEGQGCLGFSAEYP